MVICLEQGADLHMAQLMPLPLTVSCFSKIQIGFAFLVPAHQGSPGQRAVKRVRVCRVAGNSTIKLWILQCFTACYKFTSKSGDEIFPEIGKVMDVHITMAEQSRFCANVQTTIQTQAQIKTSAH